MTYLRSFRLPDEMRDQLAEEAKSQGRSVNRYVVDVLREVMTGEVVATVAPSRAQAERVEKAAKKQVRAKPKPPKPEKAAEAPVKAKAEKPPIECRHGIPHCRICLTGRYAQ